MAKKAKDRGRASKKERRAAALTAMLADATQAEATPMPEVAAVHWPAAQGVPDVDPAELAARLASLSTVLQRHISRADTGDGLTRARLSALALLVLGGPRTLGALAAAEGVRPPTMTRLVHAMEAEGLVERGPNPGDRRSVILRATPRGEGLLEQGRARQVAPLATSIAALQRAERVTLDQAAGLLGRLLREADREPAASDR